MYEIQALSCRQRKLVAVIRYTDTCSTLCTVTKPSELWRHQSRTNQTSKWRDHLKNVSRRPCVDCHCRLHSVQTDEIQRNEHSRRFCDRYTACNPQTCYSSVTGIWVTPQFWMKICEFWTVICQEHAPRVTFQSTGEKNVMSILLQGSTPAAFCKIPSKIVFWSASCT